MKEIELGEVQAAFADIIWANEPVGSGELVKLSSGFPYGQYAPLLQCSFWASQAACE